MNYEGLGVILAIGILALGVIIYLYTRHSGGDSEKWYDD